MYVVFEGVDGAGKTTQLKRVKKALDKQLDIDVKLIREEEIFFERGTSVEEKILRYALQRYRLGIHKIKPYKDDVLYLSDRSFYSSLAYQGLNSHYVQLVRDFNREMPVPQVVFFFKHSRPSVKLRRVQENYESVLPLGSVTVVPHEHSVARTTEIVLEYLFSKL